MAPYIFYGESEIPSEEPGWKKTERRIMRLVEDDKLNRSGPTSHRIDAPFPLESSA
jgi:hypothetical protein